MVTNISRREQFSAEPRRINVTPDMIDRAKRDQQAFADLYVSHQPRIYKYLLRHVKGQREVAEDLDSGVWLKVCEGLDSYEPLGLPFSAWLYRVARNHLIDSLRVSKKHAVVTGSIDSGPDIPVSDAPRHRNIELKSELDPALEQLTIDQRNVVTLRLLYHLTTRETAEALEKTPEAVKKLQARSLVQLRRILTAGRRADSDGNGVMTDFPSPAANGHEHPPIFSLAHPAIPTASGNGVTEEVGKEVHGVEINDAIIAARYAPEAVDVTELRQRHQNGHNGSFPDPSPTRKFLVYGYSPDKDVMAEKRMEQAKEAAKKTPSLPDLNRQEAAMLKLLLPDDPSLYPNLNTMDDLANMLEVHRTIAYRLRSGALSVLARAQEQSGSLPPRVSQELNRLSGNPHYRELNWKELTRLIQGARGRLGFKQLITA